MRAISAIHWGRVVIAGLASEVAVIAVLGIVIAGYRFLIAPGRDAAEYQAFGERAAYYVAPAAAGVAAFFSALWAARKLFSGFIASGTLVGVAGVVFSVGFLFTAKPEDRFMYGVSFALRILGGFLGGVVAQRISTGHLSFSAL